MLQTDRQRKGELPPALYCTARKKAACHSAVASGPVKKHNNKTQKVVDVDVDVPSAFGVRSAVLQNFTMHA